MIIQRLAAVSLLFLSFAVAQAPKGTVPKAAADRYSAHAEQDGNSIGATMLKPSQVRKAFSTDLEACCVAVEVALYPAKDRMLDVEAGEFVLRVVGQDIATRASSAELIAGKLQRKNQPDRAGDRNVIISPRTGIGYETGGIDPTGARRGGVITSTGVDVAVGGPRGPQPGGTEADRRTMELELREKGLPEGNTASPVSGFLYFSVPKDNAKKVKYQLEYTLNGTKVVLPL